MSSDTEPSNAIDALRDSLGDDALLHRLDSQDPEFEPHKKDFPNVVRQTLLLGSIRGNQPLRRTPSVYIYLCRRTLTLCFHSYFPDGKPGNYYLPDDAFDKTIKHKAFQLATNPMEVIALATYYYIVLDDRTIDFALTMTKTQKEALISICERASVVRQVPTTSPRLSKAVKLRVRIPPELLREMSQVRNGSTRQISQPSDINIKPPGSELEGMPKFIGQQDAVVASLETAPSGDVARTRVDRYMHLQSCESKTQEKLENHRRNMEVLRQSLDRTQTQLVQEIQEANALLEKQTAYGLEKKRVLDSMSPEDDHELGLRHRTVKRHKVGGAYQRITDRINDALRSEED